MRDQDIREMLYNAEEPVSPGVWSAVVAGLDAKSKRVVPLWMWSAVAFAAAAAVAVGVFLWRPASNNIRLEEFTPASPLAARLDYTLPADIVMPTEAKPAPVRIAAAPIALREESSLEAVPTTATINPEALLKRSSRLAMPPMRSSYVPTVEDNSLINALAWEARPLPGRDISLVAGGNLQASSRVQAMSRRGAAAPENTTAEGLYNPTGDKPGFPFSASIGIKWNITPRLAIGTGARYTLLSRSFVADYQSGEGWGVQQKPVDNVQHWIGVPVNVYYDIVSRPRLKVHAFAGGAMDYLLQNKFTIHSDKDIVWRKDGTSFQWSAAAGAGVEYMVLPWMGLYLDPSVRYYFGQAGGADINGLPVHPVRFVVEAGLRFSIGSY